MTTFDYPTFASSSLGNMDNRLPMILRLLREHTLADCAIAFETHPDTHQPNVIAVWPEDSAHDLPRVQAWLYERLGRIKPSGQEIIGPNFYSLDETLGYTGAGLWVFNVQEDTPAGIIVFYQTRGQSFNPNEAADVATLIDLARTVLEHQQMIERLLFSEAIAATTRAITRNPSPQSIVNALRDHILDDHVSACALLIYGPVTAQNPNGPFEYLELVGLWIRGQRSDDLDSIGQRFPLIASATLLEQLEEQGQLTILDPTIVTPFMTTFGRVWHSALQPKSITLLPLHAHQRRLGLLAVTTDLPHPFNSSDLQALQLVSGFLTMTTIAETLQEQNRIVEQGRAAILDAVTDGVVMVRPDHDAPVLTINHQFTAMFGLRSEKVVGLSLVALLDAMRLAPEVRQEILQTQVTTQDDGKRRVEGEFRMMIRGVEMDVEWYTAPVYREDALLGRIYTFNDITAKRSSERLRYELLSRISHELRTPLTSISGFAQFVLDRSKDDLPDIAREYIEIILDSARHLSVLFKDMIELARANTREMKLQTELAQMSDLVIDVVARLELHYKKRQQKVVMELSDDLPQVEVDVIRVNQVLNNLIYNAIKYGPEASEIRVSNTLIRTSTDLPRSAPPETHTPCLLLSVIDQGPGITEADVNNIFLPFYRTRASRAAKIEGSGLGLAVSRGIIELHGGRIWAESNKRAPGGRFFFTLPLGEE